jgi:zinc protease
LEDFHARLVRADNCVLAVFGDIDPEAARKAIEAAFHMMRASSGKPVIPPLAVNFPNGVKRALEQPEKKQAVVVIGWPGCTIFDRERHALDLLQETCSDLGSRLFLRIREELGLAYYVGAQNFAGVVPGYFGFYAGTAPEHAERVELELLAEAAALRERGVTEDELRRAKAKLVGQRKIARQDLGALASATALDELHGLGYDNFDREDSLYEAVTAEDVRAAAAKYLSPQVHVISVVRPASA